MGTPTLQVRPGNPDFLDLPWDQAVDDWDHQRLVEMPTGVHRHPVVFVVYEEGIYAIKEMPVSLAANEYQVLRQLGEITKRVARSAGLVQRGWLDPHEEQAAAVITRFVDHSFPYLHLISGPGFGQRRGQMLDAFAGLLVEMHLAGCYWGDCSLSNVLYRYDAGAIEAIMIDLETSSLHKVLSDGQRREDLEIMKLNLAGEMSDIAAMNDVEIEHADLVLGEDVERRYEALWAELTQELVISRDEGYLIKERIDRLHDLGFSVDDFYLEPTDAGNLVTMRAHVGGRTFHSQKLRELTGIDASENQARVLLNDLNYHLAKHGVTTPSGKSVATIQWLNGTFQPMVERVAQAWPKAHRGENPIQGFCDYLNYRAAKAREAGSDIPDGEAFEWWIADGFPGFEPGD